MALPPLMSVGAPQPWPPPPPISNNKAYNFCEMQPICSLNCPQYCTYVILPPPPPPLSHLHSSTSNRISPQMVTLIAALSAAFLILFYFAVLFPLFRRHRRNIRRNSADPTRTDSGLDETFIGQITAFKYRRSEGLIDGTECAVCLSEFKEEENLRLMPNCEHAFHIPCIDEWLKSHSSCPLCRAGMRVGRSGRVADVPEISRSSGEERSVVSTELTEVVVGA